MMKFFGLTMADYAAENTVEVYPENWSAVLFFKALGHGNWNMGAGGPTGLRFEAFREARLVLGTTLAEWREMFPKIKVMEEAALDEIYKDS